MDKNTFKCAKHPVCVFGSQVAIDPFSEDDVEEVLHSDDDGEKFIGVYKLNDGRFASIFHKKISSIVIGDEILNESIAHVASSYENIVQLGLTDEIRDNLGIKETK
jgi:hypothetical protein